MNEQLVQQLDEKTKECRGWINLVNRLKTRITDLEVELSNKEVVIEDLRSQHAVELSNKEVQHMDPSLLPATLNSSTETETETETET